MRATDQRARNAFQSLAQDFSALWNPQVRIDLSRVSAKNAPAPLSIPSYVSGSTEVVEPCVLFFPNGWNGYKYWMVFNPYPSSNAAYENASLAVSNDNVTWIVPPGLTNPVEPAPSGGYHNSDPCIFMDPDGVTMYMTFRFVGAQEIVYLRSSRDGINWTPKVPLVTLNPAQARASGPAVEWNPNTQQWMMWAVDIAQASSPIVLRTAKTITGPWSAPTNLSLTAPTMTVSLTSALSTSAAITTLPVNATSVQVGNGVPITVTSGANSQTFTVNGGQAAGVTSIAINSATPNYAYPAGSVVSWSKQFWELMVKRIGDQFVAVINVTDNGTAGGYGYEYLAVSTDGINWTMTPGPIMTRTDPNAWDYGNHYHASILPVETGTGMHLGMWYTGWTSSTGWAIGYTDVYLNGYDWFSNLDTLCAALGLANYVIGDVFNRPDTTSGLGTATTGQAWQTDAGTFGISKRNAYPTAATNTRTWIDSGLSDAHVSVVFSGVAGQNWLVFRYTDSSDYWRYGIDYGVLMLQKVISGATTTVWQLNLSDHPNGMKVAAEYRGANISLYLNDVLQTTITDVYNITATKVGMQAADTSAMFKNFTCRSLIPAA